MTPTFDDALAAAARIRPVAHRTPIASSRGLDKMCGASLLMKCENLQRTGSFKFRGAYNALGALTLEERAAGVLATSAGNHAQGVALAAGLLGCWAFAVMPADTPTCKSSDVHDYGAKIVSYDRYEQDREVIAHSLVQRHGNVHVHPFDDPHVLAGQGTAAAGLFDDRQNPLDDLLVPLGGGASSRAQC